MKLSKGITLVELMIAVAVIGILAVVAVPAYQNYILSADTNKCAQYILGARLNVTNLITANEVDISTLDGEDGAVDLGLTDANKCSGGIPTVDVTADVLTIVGISGEVGSTQSRVFTMSRQVNGAWSCATSVYGSPSTILSNSCTEFSN